MGRKALVTDRIYVELNRLNKQKNGGKKRLHAKEALIELKSLVKSGGLPLGTKLPGESAIRKALQEINKPFDSPLDKAWTVGSCVKYDIPGEMIPYLLEIQQKLGDKYSNTDFSLTIRVAVWFGRLFEVIEKLLKEKKPDYSETQKLGYHGMFAIQYAGLDRLSELLGKDCAETWELDAILRELDVNKGFFNVMLPTLKEERDQRKVKKNERSHSKKG